MVDILVDMLHVVVSGIYVNTVTYYIIFGIVQPIGSTLPNSISAGSKFEVTRTFNRTVDTVWPAIGCYWDSCCCDKLYFYLGDKCMQFYLIQYQCVMYRCG